MAAEGFGVRVTVGGCGVTFTTVATPDQARAMATQLLAEAAEAEESAQLAIDEPETDDGCVCPRFVVQHQHRHLAWCPLA